MNRTLRGTLAVAVLAIISVVSWGALPFAKAASTPHFARAANSKNHGSLFISAPFCCKGCSFVSGCCCGQRDKIPVVKTVFKATKTVIRTVTATRKLARLAVREVQAELETFEPLEDGYLAVEPQGVSLEERNLCPRCPAGAVVVPYNNGKSNGAGASYCCAPRKTVTKTAPKTKTVRKTVTATAKTAYVKGRVYYDIDKDGIFTQGIDKPISNTLVFVVIPPTKKGLARLLNTLCQGMTDSIGNFNFLCPVQTPGTTIAIVKSNKTYEPLLFLPINAQGGADANVPVLRPKTIQVNLPPRVENNMVTVTGSDGNPGDIINLYSKGKKIGFATVQLDGTWSVPSMPLGSGSYPLSVTQMDAKGAESEAVSAGTATILDPPVISSKTTSGKLGTIKGTGSPGAIVKIFVNGTFAGTAIVDAQGAYTVIGVQLAQGANNITATQENGSGVSDRALGGLITLAPAVPKWSKTTLSGNVATVSGKGKPGALIKLYSKGAAGSAPIFVASGTVLPDGTFEIKTPGLAVGSHNFELTQTDDIGTSGFVDASSVNVTTTPAASPKVTSRALLPGRIAQVKGTGAPNAIITLYSDGALVGTATVGGDGTFTVISDSALTIGTHTLSITQTIGQAMSPSVAARSVTVNTDPLVVSSTTLDKHAITVVGTGEPNSDVFLYSNGTMVASGKIDAQGAFMLTTPDLPFGLHQLTVKQKPSGLLSVLSAAVSAGSKLIEPAALTVTSSVLNDDIVTVQGAAEPGATVFLYSNGTLVGQAVVDAQGAYSVDSSALVPGLHELTVKQQVVGAGFSAPVSAGSKTIIAPLVYTSKSQSGTGGSTVTVLATGQPGATIALFSDGNQVGTATVGPDGTVSISNSAPLAAGTHVLTLTQTFGGSTSAPVAAGSVTVTASGQTTTLGPGPQQTTAPGAGATTTANTGGTAQTTAPAGQTTAPAGQTTAGQTTAGAGQTTAGGAQTTTPLAGTTTAEATTQAAITTTVVAITTTIATTTNGGSPGTTTANCPLTTATPAFSIGGYATCNKTGSPFDHGCATWDSTNNWFLVQTYSTSISDDSTNPGYVLIKNIGVNYGGSPGSETATWLVNGVKYNIYSQASGVLCSCRGPITFVGDYAIDNYSGSLTGLPVSVVATQAVMICPSDTCPAWDSYEDHSCTMAATQG